MRAIRRPALAIMARAPIPGQIKTRLQPYLTPQQCAVLYEAMMRDTIDAAVSARAYDHFVAFTPREHGAFFEKLLPPSVGLLPQIEGDLGERMYHIFLDLEYRGYNPIVIIGSDLPTLPPDRLEEALAQLTAIDVCLGPNPDGGYYLIGAKRAHRTFFEDIPWSTSTVLADTVSKITDAGLSHSLLAPCADVDTVDDIRRLRRHIELLQQTNGPWIPHRTASCLTALDL